MLPALGSQLVLWQVSICIHTVFAHQAYELGKGEDCLSLISIVPVPELVCGLN